MLPRYGYGQTAYWLAMGLGAERIYWGPVDGLAIAIKKPQKTTLHTAISTTIPGEQIPPPAALRAGGGVGEGSKDDMVSISQALCMRA